MSALSPTAGLPASSFVSFLLEVLVLMALHMNQWDLRPEGRLGRETQLSSTVQRLLLSHQGLCAGAAGGERPGWSRPPGRVRLPGKEASLRLNVCRGMFRWKMGTPLARQAAEKAALKT